MAAGASRGLNTESDTDAWKSDIGNLLVLLIVEQGTDFQERGPRRRRATRTRLEIKRASPCRIVSMRRPGPGDGNRYTQPETRRARRGKFRPVPARPNQVIDPGNGEWSGSGVGGSSEEKQIIHGDVQVRRESGARHLGATGITSFQKNKAAQGGRQGWGWKVAFGALQFRTRIAVGEMKLSIEIPPFIRTYKENLRFILLMRTFW